MSASPWHLLAWPDVSNGGIKTWELSQSGPDAIKAVEREGA
jgi:hypothetical protein